MNETERIETEAARWLARRDSSDWSESDQHALHSWIAESTSHRVAYLRLLSSWRRANRLSILKAPQPRRWPSSWPETMLLRLRRFAPRYVIVGATLTMLAAVVSMNWPSWPDSLTATGRFSTEIGARSLVSLPDGSQLTLNTETRLRSAIGHTERTVWLDRGEAYFDVAHDWTRPFVVLSGDRRITVLGTKFAVRRSGDQVSVVVVEGRVQVEPIAATMTDKPLLAIRNDRVIAEGSGALLVKQTETQVAGELSWRQGTLTFDQTTLADAAAEFNRYNRKKLVILDPQTAQLRVGGSFVASNVRGFVQLLQRGFGLVVRETHDSIEVSN